MTMIVCLSAGGSPGVTTTALGLALAWPRDVLLADCDPHPSQAVLAGYLRGLPAGGRGLGSVMQAYRAMEPESASRLLDHTVSLADDPSHTRRFLPGFTHPRSAMLFAGYWGQLVRQFDEVQGTGTDLLIDCGRLDAEGLPGPLLERARQVVVVTRSNLPALAALRLTLPELRAALQNVGAELRLVVVGGGQPYSAAEIANQLDVGLLADLPFDQVSARVLSEGTPSSRKLTDRPLWRGMHALSVRLAGQLVAA